MSDIIPRKKAIPVQARRSEMQPEVIQMPVAQPASVPPPAAGTTQNIIYVNMPAQQAPPPQTPPPAPQGPQEVHFHTTHIYASQRRQRGTSFLGCLGIVLGGIGIGAAYVPQVAVYTKQVAIAGAGCAGLGFLGAMLFRRSGRGVPFLGLLICGFAYCLMLKNTGQLSSVYAHVRDQAQMPKIEVATPAITPAPSPAAPNPAAGVAASPAAHSSATSDHPGDHTIFGDGAGDWTRSTAAPVAPAPVVIPAPSVVAPQLDRATASDNLDRARALAAKKMHLDYAAAKTDAAQAQADYREARIANAPGSPELIAASEKHLRADSELNIMLNRIDSDPGVVSAKSVLKSIK